MKPKQYLCVKELEFFDGTGYTSIFQKGMIYILQPTKAGYLHYHSDYPKARVKVSNYFNLITND